MARGNSPANKAPEATDAPAEAVVETPVTEAPAEATSAEATPTEAPAENKVEDLTAFIAAASTAVDGADKATGDLTEDALKPVVEAYRALDGKGKRNAKKSVNELMRAAVEDRDMIKARAWMKVNDALTDGAATAKAAKEPVDPTQAFVDGGVAITLARQIYLADVPEGVKDGWKDTAASLVTELAPQVDAYRAYLKEKAEAQAGTEVNEPEGISDVVRAAFRLASGKGTGLKKKAAASTGARPAFDGPKRLIANHIKEAFADLPSGAFLSVAEIRAKKSSEYGDELPSSGAISARLFPQSGKVTVEGIKPGEKDGKKGAFKV